MPRPVLMTVAPRARPSVGLRQMQRTRPSPICWATSAVMTHLGPVDDEAHLDGHVDLGQGVRRELDVDDRAGDRDDAAVLEVLGLGGVGGNGGHAICSSVAWG